MPRKKINERRNDTARPGFQRWTTFVRLENIKALKVFAAKNRMYVMDLIDEIFTEWRNRNRSN